MLACKILTTEADLDAIADEWRQLYARVRSTPVVDYDRFRLQWDMLGRHDTRKLHVVAGFREGKLAGVLPLTVLKRKVFRFLQADAGAGAECDLLAETPADADALWHAARKSPHYDIARIQGVRPQTLCEARLQAFAHPRDPSEYFYLNNKWSSGKEWLEAIDGATRREYRRKVRRLEEVNTLKHNIYEGGPVPLDIVEQMMQHKTAWAARGGKVGYLNHPGVIPYYKKFVETAAIQGTLFLAWMTLGDAVIGYNLGLIDKDVLHSHMLAYDPAHARHAPAELTMVSMICWAIDKGLKSINFMSSIEESEKRFKRKYANAILPGAEYTFSGTLYGRMVETGFVTIRRVMRALQAGKTGKGMAPPPEPDNTERKEA